MRSEASTPVVGHIFATEVGVLPVGFIREVERENRQEGDNGEGHDQNSVYLDGGGGCEWFEKVTATLFLLFGISFFTPSILLSRWAFFLLAVRFVIDRSAHNHNILYENILLLKKTCKGMQFEGGCFRLGKRISTKSCWKKWKNKEGNSVVLM